MPTAYESRFLLNLLKFWSKLYTFPYEVIPSSGRLYHLRNTKKNLLKVLRFLSIVHAIHSFVHMLGILLFYRERLVLYHLPAQFVGAIVPSFFHLSHKACLIDNPDAVKLVFNELFDSGRTHPRKWKELRVGEFLGIYVMFPLTMCTYFEYFAFICLDSSMSHLIINIGPLKGLKNNPVFVLFAYCCEAYALAMWLVPSGFFLSLNCLVISNLGSDFGHVRTNLRSQRHMYSVRRSLSAAVTNQLYTQIFNMINSWFLHASKLVCIVGAIVTGVACLRYKSQPLVVIFSIYIHFSTITAYCCTFQPGYSVILSQQNAKRAIFTWSRNIGDRVVRHRVLSKIRSLRCIGVKVGEFHEIERNSTITFVDYVERQIIGLLLAF